MVFGAVALGLGLVALRGRERAGVAGHGCRSARCDETGLGRVVRQATADWNHSRSLRSRRAAINVRRRVIKRDWWNELGAEHPTPFRISQATP